MDAVNWALLLGVAVLALVLGAVLTWLFMRRRRTTHLKRRFGPEYEHALSAAGDRGAAEDELANRERRVNELHIRPLPEAERNRYAKEWRSVQSQFVDAPEASVAAANDLVEEVMRLRGYPLEDFERRAADLSVDHGPVVDNYRQAYMLAERAKRGDASTEDLRQAMVHYRALFEDLLEQPVSTRNGGAVPREEVRR